MNFDRLKELLEQEYIWPAPYTFKFILPKESLEQFKEVVAIDITSIKESSHGKYISITATTIILETDQVIDVYTMAQQVSGIMCL